MKRREWIAAAVTLGFFALLLVEKTVTIRVDPVTGSVDRETRWAGVKVAGSVERSDLEAWLVRREGHHTPTWRQIARSSYNLLGQGTSASATADVPMIFPLRAGEANARLVRESTDAQLARFVETMRGGTDLEKREAIGEAYRRATGER